MLMGRMLFDPIARSVLKTTHELVPLAKSQKLHTPGRLHPRQGRVWASPPEQQSADAANGSYLRFEDMHEHRGARFASGAVGGLPSEHAPTYTRKLLQGDQAKTTYLSGRVRQVSKHFSSSMGEDDFIARLEIALFAYGFTGDNSIAMCNLCRDEVTSTLKTKLDQVFGSSFNTNGLGGVLTCGVTGVKAGLSHAPVSSGSGKERYVFFSFPHISVDAAGTIGDISRPGRPGQSCACGALQQALIDIQLEGLADNYKSPGVHEALDPEFSILKQRLARRMCYEGTDEEGLQKMTLVDMTHIAERTITDDLEYLIGHTVDPSKADYAVITGVQIHNFGRSFDDDSPNLEFVAPCSVYVVVNGERTNLDLSAIPAMTPRQIQMLATHQQGPQKQDSFTDDVCGSAGNRTTVRAIESPYTYNSRQRRNASKQQAQGYATLMKEEGLEVQSACAWPGWQTTMTARSPYKSADDNSTIIDASYSKADNQYSAIESTEEGDGEGYSSEDVSEVSTVNGVRQFDDDGNSTTASTAVVPLFVDDPNSVHPSFVVVKPTEVN